MKRTHAFGLIVAGGLMMSAAAYAGDDKGRMMDSNGDGMVSASEHEAGSRMMFDKMDTNHDGKVSAAEMDASHAAMGKDGKMGQQMSSAEKIKAVDTDGDGMISTGEHSAGSKMMFDKMDADKDGSVSKAEMEAGHQAMMKK